MSPDGRRAAAIEEKRRKEQYVVEEMIRLYCRKNHKGYDRKSGRMCPACRELTEYARLRSEKCPFMENKTFWPAAAASTVIKRKCGKRSGRSCGFPDRGCSCTIRCLPYGMSCAV